MIKSELKSQKCKDYLKQNSQFNCKDDMVPTATTALQLLIAVCTINGLNSYPTRNRNPPLGILSELIGNNGKSPLIVVLSPDRGPKVFGDKTPSSLPARDESNGYHQHNKNDRHIHKQNNLENNYIMYLNHLSRNAYNTITNDLMRTKKNHSDKQKGHDSNRLYTAEQCSDSENYSECEGNADSCA